MRKVLVRSTILKISLLAFTCFASLPSTVQAQLPPTNMGKFVHQPGDNQYTTETQIQRHPPVPIAAPVVIAAPTASINIPAPEYKLTPAQPRPDISLLPIVADEPIKPAGFPPLPDRLDLPTSSNGWGSNNSAAYNTINGRPGYNAMPTGVHQNYVHYDAGAFIPKEALNTVQYHPAAVDYYNVNSAARPISGSVSAAAPASNIQTPATQALQKMGAAPQLAPDAVSKPDVPSAVTVDQSHSQDLSLPDDDFNKHYPSSIGNSATNRYSNSVGSAIGLPLRNLGTAAVGMGLGVGMGMGMSSLYHR